VSHEWLISELVYYQLRSADLINIYKAYLKHFLKLCGVVW